LKVGGGEETGVAAAKPAVAVAGDPVVDRVAQGRGDYEENGEERPREMKIAQYAQRGCGACVADFAFDEDEGV